MRKLVMAVVTAMTLSGSAGAADFLNYRVEMRPNGIATVDQDRMLAWAQIQCDPGTAEHTLHLVWYPSKPISGNVAVKLGQATGKKCQSRKDILMAELAGTKLPASDAVFQALYNIVVTHCRTGQQFLVRLHEQLDASKQVANVASAVVISEVTKKGSTPYCPSSVTKASGFASARAGTSASELPVN